MKDYYNILDVSPVASLEKIKEQYHFLLFAWHPDRYPDNQKAKAEAIPKRGRLTIHDDKLNKQKYSATNGNEQKKSNSERNDASKKRQRLHNAVPEKSNNKENKQKPSAPTGRGTAAGSSQSKPRYVAQRSESCAEKAIGDIVQGAARQEC